MLCIVDEGVIQTILNTRETHVLHETKITIKEWLLIIHSDANNQVLVFLLLCPLAGKLYILIMQFQMLELILELWLPLIKLSTYTLDFGFLYTGDTKKLLLIVENLSIFEHNFTVKQKEKNKDFAIDQTHGRLLGQCIRGDHTFIITVSFQPRNPGQSTETLEIITDIPPNVEECVLYGEGTLDEKYHMLRL